MHFNFSHYSLEIKKKNVTNVAVPNTSLRKLVLLPADRRFSEIPEIECSELTVGS